MGDETRLLSVAEAQDRLGVSKDTLFKLVREGVLGSVKIGRRRLIPASALDAYVAGLVDTAAAALVKRTTEAQGVPATVSDEMALRLVAKIVEQANRREAS